MYKFKRYTKKLAIISNNDYSNNFIVEVFSLFVKINQYAAIILVLEKSDKNAGNLITTNIRFRRRFVLISKMRSISIYNITEGRDR